MALLSDNKAGFIGHELRSGASWRLFLFLLVVFITLMFSYLGLQFGYKAYLNSSIASYDERINEAKAQVGPEEEENLIDFYSQLVNLKSLLGKHVFASNLLNFLETSANQNVAYSTVNLLKATNEVSIDGVANSYDTLASQISFWENSSEVERVLLGQNSSDGSVVKFNVRLFFRPNFFNLNLPSAGMPSNIPQ